MYIIGPPMYILYTAVHTTCLSAHNDRFTIRLLVVDDDYKLYGRHIHVYGAIVASINGCCATHETAGRDIIPCR